MRRTHILHKKCVDRSENMRYIKYEIHVYEIHMFAQQVVHFAQQVEIDQQTSLNRLGWLNNKKYFATHIFAQQYFATHMFAQQLHFGKQK